MPSSRTQPRIDSFEDEPRHSRRDDSQSTIASHSPKRSGDFLKRAKGLFKNSKRKISDSSQTDFHAHTAQSPPNSPPFLGKRRVDPERLQAASPPLASSPIPVGKRPASGSSYDQPSTRASRDRGNSFVSKKMIESDVYRPSSHQSIAQGGSSPAAGIGESVGSSASASPYGGFLSGGGGDSQTYTNIAGATNAYYQANAAGGNSGVP